MDTIRRKKNSRSGWNGWVLNKNCLSRSVFKRAAISQESGNRPLSFYDWNGIWHRAWNYLSKKRNWKRDLLIRESGSPYIKVMPSSSNKLPQAMPITNKPIRIKMFWRRRWFSLNSTKMPTPAETSKPDNIAPVPSMPSR